MSEPNNLTRKEAAKFLPASRADLLILENPGGELLGLHAKFDDVNSATVKPLLLAADGVEDCPCRIG